MATTKKKPSRLAKALVETAKGMHNTGLLDRATYDKITTRHLAAKDLPKFAPSRLTRFDRCGSAPR